MQLLKSKLKKILIKVLKSKLRLNIVDIPLDPMLRLKNSIIPYPEISEAMIIQLLCIVLDILKNTPTERRGSKLKKKRRRKEISPKFLKPLLLLWISFVRVPELRDFLRDSLTSNLNLPERGGCVL